MTTQSPAPQTGMTPSRDLPTDPRRLLRAVAVEQRRAVIGATALLSVWQLSEAAVPVLIGVIIDQAVATGDIGRLVVWGAVLCVHFAVLSTAYRLGARIVFRGFEVASHRLRTAVSAHVLDARGARTAKLPGDLLSVATSDAEQVALVLRQLASTTAGVVGLVATGVVLARIDPLLALVVLLGVPSVLGVTQLLARPLTARSEVRQEAIGKAVGTATDLVAGVRPLVGFGGVDTALSRYRRHSREAAEASIVASRWEGLLVGSAQGLSGLFLAAVALVAGTRAVQGEIGVGELIAVVGLAQFVAEPIRMLSYLVAELAKTRASANRIAAVLASPRLVVSAERRLTQAGDPSTEGMVLRVDRVRHRSLQDLSFDVADSELVALLVEAPVDAAAVMALLHCEAEPESGQVLLHGQSLTAVDLSAVRRTLLAADHHVDLFEGDLRDNIDASGRLGAAELARVLAATAADDVVEHCAHGLAQPVAAGGSTLSGGQRQRVGLARALAADPPMLVLHDPTTAVDAVTEARIATGIRELRHGVDVGSAITPDSRQTPRSTLVLTSSPVLLAVADRVVHVREGCVVGTGTHRELMARTSYRTAVLR